ncbi:MAG: hypothetical protein LQ341_002241 [Variospora aurantia]|nr:MAG: hypothetical protein LQ341_002241 [Variospora aurantia]
MDPLSITAGVLGISAAAAQASKSLYEMIEGIRSAPDEIKNISRDNRAFYSILYSLEIALKDPKITKVIADDDALTAYIDNLREPLANCSSVLGQLMVKIQGFIRPLDGERYRMSSNDLKWYFGRKEVLELTARVEACKNTLDTGLTAIGTLCSVRLMAAGGGPSGKPVRRGSGDTDAGFVLRRYAEERDAISQYAGSVRTPSPPSEAFKASMRLDQSSPTLQGTESSKPTANKVDKIEMLRRAENQRAGLLGAIQQGDDLLLEIAIEEGANVNAKGADGKAPLHLAAMQGNPDIVQLLIDHGADINIPTSLRGDNMERKFNGQRTPLHWACDRGHESCIRLLVKHGADVNANSYTNRTPLQEALMRGHVSISKFLLENGASVKSHDDEGWTPLHQAAISSKAVEVIHLLLDKGADIEAKTFTTNIWNLTRRNEATPLFLAAGEQESTVKALMDRGADLRCRNMNGEMPIHVACWRGYASTVKRMLDAGIDIEERDHLYEETPLLKAASTGQTLVLKLLLDRGANMDALTQYGRNALVHAQLHRKEGNEEAVRFLEREYRKKQDVDSWQVELHKEQLIHDAEMEKLARAQV